MVDGVKPAMRYEAIDHAKEAIKATYNDKRQKYLPLWKIIDDRWILEHVAPSNFACN